MQLRKSVLVRRAALLFVAALLFHCAGTWSLPLIDQAEPRFAEASREMRERGDYVVPYFNNHERFDKPPLIYWLQVGSYHLFGENDFAARFPSVLASAFTALLLFFWGRRMADERLGWWAAIIFTLSAQVFLHGRAALPDLWLVFFVTAAFWAGFELMADRLGAPTSIEPSHEKYWRVAFYVALGFAFLAKGPIGWVPLLTVWSTKIFLRGPSLHSRFRFLTGIPITLIIVLGWGIPAVIRTHGEFFRVGIGHHIVERSFGGTSQIHGINPALAYSLTLPFYFIAVFASFFPWSIRLPGLIRRLWQCRDQIDNFLIAGIVPTFVILSLVSTKFFHYSLPVFPLLALLLARHLFELPGSKQFAPRAAIATVVIFLGTALFVYPLLARTMPVPELFKKARADLRPEMEFAIVGYHQPSAVWYFRSRLRNWLHGVDSDEVRPFMDSPGARLVILPTETARELYPQLPPNWKMFRSAGFIPARGKRFDVTLILKP
jgi:4-amino-4-deoxy-L-arabinose transferase-like glycosyltransferase